MRFLPWLLSFFLVSACSKNEGTEAPWILSDGYLVPENTAYDFAMPATIPRPAVPEDEPITDARVQLGRHLFYDPRLSRNQNQSCASCHKQELAFSDGMAFAIGSLGDLHFRNSQSLTNVGYVSALTWANPVLSSLAEQALIPMFGEAPIELGMAGHEDELLRRISAQERYRALYERSFPGEENPITVRNTVLAIAAFERTLVSYRSDYDRAVYLAEPTAMSEAAKRGMNLFFSERLECFHCHGGFNFSDTSTHEGQTIREAAFHNTGLYDVDGRGGYPASDTGLHRFTQNPRDMGKFRAPSLRNVELTAPYFHDGSAQSLEEVLSFYERGGRLISSGANAGDGRDNLFKDIFIRGFTLTATEREDVLSFLRALTDREFVRDARFANPWEPANPAPPDASVDAGSDAAL